MLLQSAHPGSSTAIARLLAMPGLRVADVLALLQAAQRGRGPEVVPAAKVLEGRHVAVVASSNADATAEVFTEAARALGARTAHIAPDDLGLHEAADAPETARVLGRLYAAIGCSGLHPQSLALLQKSAGVPVLHDLAAATHSSRLLADLMTMKQALHEAGQTRTTPLRLAVQGKALLQAWRRLEATDFIDVFCLSETDAQAQASRCDFVGRPGSPPELFVVGPDDILNERPSFSLLARQRANHGLVVQVMLRNEVGARR